MRHASLTLGLLATAALLIGCSDDGSGSANTTPPTADNLWPTDRADHEAIMQAVVGTLLADIQQRAADGGVDPLTMSLWDTGYDAVDAILDARYGLTLNHSLDDQDSNGLVDDASPTMTVFWMQQSDSPKEQCEGLVDIPSSTTEVTCTPV